MNKIRNLLILNICLLSLITFSCENSDDRVKIINNSKKDKIVSSCIIGYDTCNINFGVINCNDLDSSHYAKRIFSKGDSLTWSRPFKNAWETLRLTDTVVVYVLDKTLFEQYCKGKVRYDSCYERLAFTKDELNKVNWKIIIDK